MQKKILSASLGLMIAISSIAPVFANVTSAGGTGSVPVELNAAATSFSVTVPTSLPIDVAADGVVTVCQDNSIINNSFGPVEVKAAKIETVSGWTLKDFTSRFETLKVNAQEFGFQLNECNVNTNGTVAVTNFQPIDGKASQKFTYDAKVAPQANELGKQQIASVVFTLGWLKEPPHPENPPYASGTAFSKSNLNAQAEAKTGTLTFSREKHNPATHGEGVDVSEAQDGSVMCVVKGEDVTVYGDGGVLAPTNCESMFWGYKATTMDLKGLDTSQVTNMRTMFYNSAATTITGLSSFDTSNVTNMDSMFGLSNATTLDLSSFDTSKVTTMKSMFYLSKVTSLDLSSFNTNKVTTMSGMFRDSVATTLNLSSFDTNNVTTMEYMFNGSKATTLDLSNFDTSNVTKMDWMFSDSAATTLNLRNFDTSNTRYMKCMFRDSQATTLDLSSFNTSRVLDMEYMFYNSAATTLNLSNFDTSNVTTMRGMFKDSKATKVYCSTEPDKQRMVNTYQRTPSPSAFVVGKP